MFLCRGKSPQRLISNACPNTKVLISDHQGGIDLLKLLPLAEAARAKNPIKYGLIPLIGPSSQEPSNYEVIGLSSDMRRAISGPRAITPLDRIDVPAHLSTIYFLVLDNRPITNSTSDEEELVEEDNEQREDGIILVMSFFFGLVCDDNEVRIPVASSHKVGVRVRSKIQSDEMTGQGI